MKITWNFIILLTSLLLFTEQNFNFHLYNINKNMNRNDMTNDKYTDKYICGEYDSIIYTCCYNHNHHFVLCHKNSEECVLKNRNNEPKCMKIEEIK